MGEIYLGSMIRQKKEFRCKECGHKYIKWTGNCYAGCKRAGTIEEHTLVKPRRTPTKGVAGEAKRIRRRAKDSERDIAKRMLVADGADPAFRNITSSTGRVGFITGMRIDAVSKTYVTENKNRKMPTWLITAWVLLNQRAVDFNKNALLHIDPPNMPKTFVINGVTKKLDTLAIITQERHEQLIEAERELRALLDGPCGDTFDADS